MGPHSAIFLDISPNKETTFVAVIWEWDFGQAHPIESQTSFETSNAKADSFNMSELKLIKVSQ